MNELSRRSALSLAVAATTVVAAGEALAQGNGDVIIPGRNLPPGVSQKVLGKRESWIPTYKSVAMVDVTFQPGAKGNPNSNMPNDMVCHVMEGELHVTKKTEGVQFTAKQGDIWTCRKGDDEVVENTGSTVGTMRVINLLPA